MENYLIEFNQESPNNSLQQVISFAGADGGKRSENRNDRLDASHDKENLEIDSDNDEDLIYWANHFQICTQALKDAILLNGNSISEIKKYLSI